MLQTAAVSEEGNLTKIPQEDKAAAFDSTKQTVSIQQPTDILQAAQQLLTGLVHQVPANKTNTTSGQTKAATTKAASGKQAS